MLSLKEKREILELKKKYSIYSVWANRRLFKTAVEELSRPFKGARVDKVLGVEARGFILGAAVAYKLGVGFVVARKKGNMYKGGYSRTEVFSDFCVDYSGKKKVLEIENHDRAIKKGNRVLIIDDWMTKGEQIKAVVRLVQKAGGEVAGVGVMLDDMRDSSRGFFKKYKFVSLVKSKTRLFGR